MSPGQQPVTDERLADRYLGALLGLAVGDALSTALTVGPVGGQAADPSRALMGAMRWVTGPAAATAIAVAESLLFRRRLDGEHLSRTLVTGRTRHDHHDPRSSTGPLDRLTVGQSRHAVARTHGTDVRFQSEPAMRSAPISLFAEGDVTLAVALARRAAEVTHRDTGSLDGAGVVAGVVAMALGRPGRALDAADLASLAELALDATMRDQLRRIARLEVEAPTEAATLIGTGPAVVEVVPAALWAVAHHEGDFVHAMHRAVDLRGQHAAVLAVAGAVAGALQGASAIPDEWCERVESTDHMRELANRFLVRARAEPDVG